MPFILFAIFKKKKKKEISNFKIWKFENSKIQKKKKKKEKRKLALSNKKTKKKKSNFEFQNSKNKKIMGYTFLFYFHEPRSSQAIESLSWDPEPRPFQDPTLWATEPRSEPLSHDPTKPSRDLLQAKIQATEPLSRDPSHRAEIRAKPSWAKIFELFFYKHT